MRGIRLVFALTLISASYAALGEEAQQRFQAPSSRIISGTEIVHYKTGPVPVDLSGETIAALVPNGGGGYNVFAGTGKSNGTFAIPNVPSGFYLLQIGTTYVWTSDSVVDADSIADYRSDIVQADPSTTVTFDLTNLHKWQQTDFFEMVCPNNAAFNFFFGTVGETTFTGTFPYFGALSMGSEGDQYHIAQLITQNLGGYPFTGLGRYIAPPEFTQAQGSNTPIDGMLKTIAKNHEFEANINGADLAAQALAANPGAVLFDTIITLDVYPGSFAHGLTTSTPDLVILSSPPFLMTNGDLGQVLYGNPYPKDWPQFASYSWGALTSYLAPGATNSTSLLTAVFGSTPNLPTSTSPITPLVGVVKSPSVNRKNFFTNHTAVGITPTLRWSPPSVGSANNYIVGILQLTNNGGNTVITSVASIYTQSRSLRIPPGLLSAGQAYVFEIASYHIPGVNFAKTPFMNGAISATAYVASGVMQP